MTDNDPYVEYGSSSPIRFISGKVLKAGENGVPHFDDPCVCRTDKLRCPQCEQVVRSSGGAWE